MSARPVKPSRFFCFVLMPFDKAFNKVYDEAVKRACDQIGAKCVRVDRQIYRGKIMDRIYEQIAEAGLVVADVTGSNPNVLYEVGYAHALNKSAILITQSTEDIPFDVKDFHHLEYDLADLAGLRKSIVPWLRQFANLTVNPSDLTGQWILGIFDPDASDKLAPPYKIDGYTIRQQGRFLSGSIKRIFGPGTLREYSFSGYTDGREIVYSFMSTNLDVHSWGCCNLERRGDHRYEGYYFWPQEKARLRPLSGSHYGERIIFIRADHFLEGLGLTLKAAARKAIRSWIEQ